MLLRRPAGPDGSHSDEFPAPDRQHRLFLACHTWLAGQLKRVVAEDRPERVVFGAPSRGGRLAGVTAQCHLCRSGLGESAAFLDCIFAENATVSWPTLLVCNACDHWVASLVEDGRSLRGSASRELDGPYGSWLHPNLRALAVGLDIVDERVREVVVAACERMGVTVDSSQGMPDLVVQDVAGRLLAGRTPRAARHILLVRLTDRAPLLADLGPALADWLTIPITPQQVTAALARFVTERNLRLNWDLESGLPVANLRIPGRPSFTAVPSPGVDLFEVGWLLKRFARGYDQVVSVEGEIVLLPRAEAAKATAIAIRLQRLLGDRCTIVLRGPGQEPRRFEASA